MELCGIFGTYDIYIMQRFDDIRPKVSDVLQRGKIVIMDDGRGLLDDESVLFDCESVLFDGLDAYKLYQRVQNKIGRITLDNYAGGTGMHVFAHVTCIVCNIASDKKADVYNHVSFVERMCALLPHNCVFILGAFDKEPNDGDARKMEEHMEIHGDAYRRIFEDVYLCEDPKKGYYIICEKKKVLIMKEARNDIIKMLEEDQNNRILFIGRRGRANSNMDDSGSSFDAGGSLAKYDDRVVYLDELPYLNPDRAKHDRAKPDRAKPDRAEGGVVINCDFNAPMWGDIVRGVVGNEPVFICIVLDFAVHKFVINTKKFAEQVYNLLGNGGYFITDISIDHCRPIIIDPVDPDDLEDGAKDDPHVIIITLSDDDLRFDRERITREWNRLKYRTILKNGMMDSHELFFKKIFHTVARYGNECNDYCHIFYDDGDDLNYQLLDQYFVCQKSMNVADMPDEKHIHAPHIGGHLYVRSKSKYYHLLRAYNYGMHK